MREITATDTVTSKKLMDTVTSMEAAAELPPEKSKNSCSVNCKDKLKKHPESRYKNRKRRTMQSTSLRRCSKISSRHPSPCLIREKFLAKWLETFMGDPLVESILTQ